MSPVKDAGRAQGGLLTPAALPELPAPAHDRPGAGIPNISHDPDLDRNHPRSRQGRGRSLGRCPAGGRRPVGAGRRRRCRLARRAAALWRTGPCRPARHRRRLPAPDLRLEAHPAGRAVRRQRGAVGRRPQPAGSDGHPGNSVHGSSSPRQRRGPPGSHPGGTGRGRHSAAEAPACRAGHPAGGRPGLGAHHPGAVRPHSCRPAAAHPA